MENNNIDIPPFYIGQEIVSRIDAKDYNSGRILWKKGDEFVVKAIKRSCCEWLVYIGVESGTEYMQCGICHKGKYKSDHFWSCSIFAPKIEIGEFISLKEVSEKALELTSAN